MDYALGLARETSNGFNAKLDGNPDRDDHRSTAANGRLGWQCSTPRTAWRATSIQRHRRSYDGSYDVSKPADDLTLHRMHAAGLNWQTQWNDNYKTRLSVTDSRDRYETQPCSISPTPSCATTFFQRAAPGRAPVHGGAGAA